MVGFEWISRLESNNLDYLLVLAYKKDYNKKPDCLINHHNFVICLRNILVMHCGIYTHGACVYQSLDTLYFLYRAE